MSIKRHRKNRNARVAACRDKVSFSNYPLAARAARRINSRAGGAVAVYHYPFCHAFHVGGKDHLKGRRNRG